MGRSRPKVDTAFRRFVVKSWIAQFGYVCPGWGREPHPARDLTFDHSKPRSKGGAERQKPKVLCRSCNSRKYTRTAPTVPPESEGPRFKTNLPSRRRVST